MSSSTKLTPRQNFRKLKSPHLLEGSFDLDKSPVRPNSSMATPTYSNKFHSKSSHSTLKRTRSNSSIPTEGPKVISTGEKSTTSPINLQLSMQGPSPKMLTELGSNNSLHFEKRTSQEILSKNRKKNPPLGRMFSSNGWSGQKKGSQQMLDTSHSELKRHQSPMHGRETKRKESSSKRDIAEKSKSQLKELSLGYSKSVSYGIIEPDAPSTQRASRASKKSNKVLTPVFTIDCHTDLKESDTSALQENVSKNNIDVQTPPVRMTLDKINQSTGVTKRASRGSSAKRSESGTIEKKEIKRGKENTFDDSQLKGKDENKLTHKVPSFFNKKFDSKPPARPSTTKAAVSRREETGALSEISNRQAEKPVDVEYSQKVLRGTRLQMLHVNSATATPKNYFVPKTTSSATHISSSPRSMKTPRTSNSHVQTVPNTNVETQSSIQPSKNSDFSFKMMYFKPIEDSKLDEFIRDVNDSHYPKKELNKAHEKSRHMTEPVESSFSTPLPSEVPVKVRAQQFSNRSKDNSIVNSEEVISAPKKIPSGLKKSLAIENKNPNSVIEKTPTHAQDLHGRPPKPRNVCKVKEERQSTNECFPERALSPSFESRKGLMSAEKPKVKDTNTPIESKARTTYSKLDKLLQEIKSNPGSKNLDDEGKPDPSDLEKELFGQSSKGISSSSSTNCSITKSYAHTLMKVSVNPY